MKTCSKCGKTIKMPATCPACKVPFCFKCWQAHSVVSLARKLKALNACSEAVSWAKDRNWPTAWQECQRGDWMLWLCGTMQGKKGWPERPAIVLVACDCAELVLPIFEKKHPNDKRVRECIEVTRKWAAGEATIEEVRKARNAADAATATAAAATAAAATAAARTSIQTLCADFCRNRLVVPEEL